VMEKCTYCVQRITAGRIAADKENRKLADGEVKTACQMACPTRAIAFGDLNDKKSEIARLVQSNLHYALLGELNTRPRTTYQAELRNPNPNIK
jgi:Fe-S-cluster-containing dehydrogenase component